MPMLGKTKERFDRAQAAYDRATELIRSLDQAYQKEAFRDMPARQYDSTITLYQFDQILQAILLNMALIDGEFHRLERLFILRIPRYGDLMPTLREEMGNPHLDWKGISRLSPETRQALLDHLPGTLDRTCNSFVLPLAQADALDPEDFLLRLERELQEIAESLRIMDGRILPEEAAAYREMSEHLLVDRWRRIVEEKRQNN